MRLFRLAYFNLKKHKAETSSLFLLIMLCMALVGTAVSGLLNTRNLFDDMFEKTQGLHNVVYMSSDEYKLIYRDYFRNDLRIKDLAEVDCVYNISAKFVDKEGKEKAFVSVFMTEENDAKIENVIIESSLTKEEIYAKEHFIILPYYAKSYLKYEEGDTFELIFNNKSYPFEVAGFYESSFFSGSADMKMIVGGNDFNALQQLMGKYKMFFYDLNDQNEADEFLDDFYSFATDNAVRGEVDQMIWKHISYSDEKEYRLNSITLLMELMIIMSAVVFLSIVFMITFRIRSDIEEQMVSIGVLEALGYKSGEISLTYVMEYFTIALPAVITGFILSLFTYPFVLRIGENLIGHRSTGNKYGMIPVVFGAAMVLVVALISGIKALSIRKYPPVVAFRKGTGNHTHHKDLLRLEKTRSNVHLRLAAKGFLSSMKTNIGMGLVISVSVISLMVCFVLGDIADRGIDALLPLAGIDVSDITVVPTTGTDIAQLNEEIAGMPEVRKTLLSNDFYKSFLFSGNIDMTALVYDDFDRADNLNVIAGRLPKHENEVALRKDIADKLGKQLGDNVSLKYGKNEEEYIISGIVKAPLALLYDFAYMTEEAYRRLDPSYISGQVEVFLKEGADKEAFKKKLIEIYGSPAIGYTGDTDGNSLEDRLRTEADKKMSTLLEMYGVTSVDYAIQIGDMTIKGNSSKFKIKEITTLTSLLSDSVEPIVNALKTGTRIFMTISSFTIIMIVFLVIHSAVRRQRGELGIMKGLGYTSGELIMQTALRMVPILVISVILGSIAAIEIGKLLYSKYGELPIVVSKIVIIAAIVVAFGFAVAYFSARKIKNISVYELMQE